MPPISWTRLRQRAGAVCTSRRLGTLAAAALLTLPMAPAFAQSDKGPIRMLVGFPAGGTIDVVARILSEHLKDELGATVIIDSKPGAGGQIAAQALKAAPADGRTMRLSPDHTMVMTPLTLKNPGFQTLTDFAPVGQVARYAGAFAVAGNVEARNLDQYFEWVKADKARGNIGVPAPGSIPQFFVHVLGQQAGTTLVSVPYRGSAPLLQDLMGGQIGAGTTALGDLLGAAMTAASRPRPRVGLIGFGGIGAQVFERITGDPSIGLDIAFVHNRSPERLAGVPAALHLHDLAFMNRFHVDLVVEMAHPVYTQQWGDHILAQASYLPLSVSALADDALRERLLATARRAGTSPAIPHGALMGLDSLREWRHQWRDVAISFFKSPANIDFSESGIDPATISAETLAEVTEREKDIRFSSRTRLNTTTQLERQAIALAAQRLLHKLPAALRNDADALALARVPGPHGVDVVHLIYRSSNYS